MIKVIYNKVCGRCVQSEPLTSGMVGQPIHFEYSHDFDGLAVTAVFTDGKNTVDVVNPGNECVIPHEVLTTVGAIVKVGVYAVRGDKIVIPTIYAHIGIVLKGADPSGDVSIDPTLPIWAQTQALIGNLSQIETETKDSLVAAINEVKQTADTKANAADLAPVATSGSYNDLSDKPTIPTVLPNPHKLTINGTEYDGSTDVQMTIEGGGSSVPKPLTYDYMPEGYPSKTMGTVTVMEEQELAFADQDGTYVANPNEAPEIAEGQTYTVNWDGADYECVCSVYFSTILALGNKSIYGVGDDTGEPFLYISTGAFATLDTSASHTISVKKPREVITPMADEFLPVASEDNYGAVKKSEIVTSYKFDRQAPHDQMVEAIAAFGTGNASIVWGIKKVINASYNSSDDTITVTFAEEPLQRLTFNKTSDGFYNNNFGSSTYKEVQGSQVRIINDNDATAVLMTEGIPGSTTLSVAVEKFSVLGGEFSGRALILSSSTYGSDKKFRITVDDSGTLSVTEVTA